MPPLHRESDAEREPRGTGTLLHCYVRGERLLLNHKEQELLIGHLLHGLLSRPVDLTAHPVTSVVGVDAEFDRLVVAA